MLDNEKIETEGAEENKEPKTYGEDEIQKRIHIQKRIEKKLKSQLEENAQLKQQLAQLAQQGQASPDTNMDLGEQEPAGNPMMQNSPQQPQSGNPLTEDGMRELLAQQQFQSRQQMHTQKVMQMLNDDPDLKRLNDENSQNGKLIVPQPIAMDITERMGSDYAKKIFKELLSSENVNNKMLASVATGNYEKWLNNLMKQDMPSESDAEQIKSVPDVAQGTGSSSQDRDDENTMNYIKSISL